MRRQHAIDDSVLANLMTAMDLVVMERQRNAGSFRILNETPRWLQQLYPDVGSRLDTVQPGKIVPFLENFLIDAECFWDQRTETRLKSGAWSEGTRSDAESHLEATAMIVNGRNLLVIERLGAEFQSQHTVLQRAREHDLKFTKTVKKNERALANVGTQLQKSQAARDDLASMIDHLGLAAIITDMNGTITFISEPARTLLGLGRDGIIGTHWMNVSALEHRAQEALQAMIRQPQHRRTSVEVNVLTSDGKRSWIAIEIRDDPRETQRRMLVLRDVTEIHALRQMLNEKFTFHDLIGKSQPMQTVYQRLKDLAMVDTTVLIEGETGTGKELVAKAIHFSSKRKDHPFLAVNCAGLTDALLGSHLFGHRRGAFTGAIANHQGFFEAASGGTLLLDEIGDMPMTVQTSVLRVLQEKEILRLGDSKPRKVDVRVLAATHQNLNELVASEKFRADLLYRIRVARVHVPALRERREDIPPLVSSFLSQCCAATGKTVENVDPQAMRKLVAYPWPGNVRELRSAIEYSVIHAKTSGICDADLPPEIIESNPPDTTSSDTPLDEKRIVIAALEQTGGNRAAAARSLGIGRATFYRRLSALGIS